MVAITLKDGSVRRFDGPARRRDRARDRPRLAKDALAIMLDGEMKDLAHRVDRDAKVEIVTREDPRALELLRHDAAHVMAEAVQELYPGTQVTFGPAIENGFYYDFARGAVHARGSREDRGAHARDRRARRADHARGLGPRARRSASSRARARATRPSLIDDPRRTRRSAVYRQGDWVDLCRGPHLPSTGKLGRPSS